MNHSVITSEYTSEYIIMNHSVITSEYTSEYIIYKFSVLAIFELLNFWQNLSTVGL